MGVCRNNFENADYRVFDFGAGESSELIEWKLTKNKGGGMGWSNKPAPPKPSIEKEIQGPSEVVGERSAE